MEKREEPKKSCFELKEDKFGFKVAIISEQTNMKDLYHLSRNKENESVWVDKYLMSDFIYQGVEIGSTSYLAGTYYYKDTGLAEYLALESDDLLGLFIKTRLPDGRYIKSALYDKNSDSIRLNTHTDDLDESSHNFHRFKSNAQDNFMPFSKDDMEKFKAEFMESIKDCSDIDKVIDINKLISEILEKGIVKDR